MTEAVMLNPSLKERDSWFSIAREVDAVPNEDIAMLVLENGQKIGAWRSGLYSKFGATNQTTSFWDCYGKFDPIQTRKGTLMPLSPDMEYLRDYVFLPSAWVGDDLERVTPGLQIKFAGDSNYTNWTNPKIRLVDTNPARQWWEFSGRLGPFMIVITQKVGLWADEVPFEVNIVFSDPTITDMTVNVDNIKLYYGEPFVLDYTARGQGQVRYIPARDRFECDLLEEPTHFGDAQMLHPMFGSVLCMDNITPIGQQVHNPGTVKRWMNLLARLEGRIETVPGPIPWMNFKVNPPHHPNDAEEKQRMLNRSYDELSANHDNWWNSFRGLEPNAGQTGSQYGFGSSKMIEATTWADPVFGLHFRAAIESALRGMHYREADGSRTMKANHPDWWTWSQVTHYNSGSSPDRLGKPSSTPWYNFHNWGGMDDQHMNDHHLNGLCAIFESPTLLSCVLDAMEVETASIRNKGGSGTGASRAIGRRSLANAGRLMLTDSDTLYDVNQNLMQVSYDISMGKNLPRGSVRPQMLVTDDRLLQDPATGEAWPTYKTWEEGLQLNGVCAHHSILMDRLSRGVAVDPAHMQVTVDLMTMICETLVLHLCWRDLNGRWIYANGGMHCEPPEAPPVDYYREKKNGWFEDVRDIHMNDGWCQWTFPGVMYMDIVGVPSGIQLHNGVYDRMQSILAQLTEHGIPQDPAARQWFNNCDWAEKWVR